VPHESRFILACYPRGREKQSLGSTYEVSRLLDEIAGQPAVRDGNHIIDKDRILRHRIQSYADLVEAIMSEKARSMGKSRWGDKTPFYTADIDVLWEIFPEAKIIHLVRDGRDVVISQAKMEWLSRSLPRLAADWRWKTTICHKVGTVRGRSHFLELKYEDLVTNTEPSLRRVCDFLDETFAPEMLEYHRTAEEEVPGKSLRWHRSSVSPPDPNKVGVWRQELSKSDRIIFEQIAGETLELFGYEREHLPTTLASRLRNLYYAIVVRW
jgi:hypothetical protein